jgi:hypothetical protein
MTYIGLKIYHVELIIIQSPNKQTLFADLLNTVFSDYWSIGTIGCIAAIWLKFGGNTKIGRSIP